VDGPGSGAEPAFEPLIDTAVWLAVREFVTEAVADCAGRTAYESKVLNIAAAQLAGWAWQSAGLPLERRIIFHRDTIAEFIVTGALHWKPAGRGNLRSQLLRMSEVLLDHSVSLRRLGALPPSDAAEPYADRDLVRLRNWADSQSTVFRQTNASVLLALGAGAGLSASEIGRLRIGDIHVDDSGVMIDVSVDRVRSVPVLRVWESILADRAATLPPESFVFRENHTVDYPNLISSFIVRSGTMAVRPTSQRLRATWIVTHLAAGTPVVELMRAPGVESLEAFTRYAKFVPRLEEHVARGLLRR
jgi:hypothetical protein